MDLVLVRRDVGDEEVANDAADGDDESCAEIVGELGVPWLMKNWAALLSIR